MGQMDTALFSCESENQKCSFSLDGEVADEIRQQMKILLSLPLWYHLAEEELVILREAHVGIWESGCTMCNLRSSRPQELLQTFMGKLLTRLLKKSSFFMTHVNIGNDLLDLDCSNQDLTCCFNICIWTFEDLFWGQFFHWARLHHHFTELSQLMPPPTGCFQLSECLPSSVSQEESFLRPSRFSGRFAEDQSTPSRLCNTSLGNFSKLGVFFCPLDHPCHWGVSPPKFLLDSFTTALTYLLKEDSDTCLHHPGSEQVFAELHQCF